MASRQLRGTSDDPQPIRVLAAVVQRDGRYLICQRAAHKRHGGLWEFPGGKLEPSETLLDAARRELAEELDLTVLGVDECVFTVADPGSHFVIDFVPTTIEGEPTCLEHQHLDWVPLDGLFAFPFAPSDQRFAEFLRTGTQTE